VLIYREFAQLLGADQPVYALQAQGLDGRRPPHATLEAMAAHYIDEIRAVQPKGPYFLGGFCFGGVISYEIAQQLHAGGERVALLAALDSTGPRPTKTWRDYARFATQALRQDPLGLARYLVSTRLLPKPIVVPGFDHASLWPSPEVGRAIIKAVTQYEPRRYPGRITWFVNSERAPLALSQWSEFAREVERWVFPGSHATAFQHPAIEVLASQVRACLERAQADQPPCVAERGGSSDVAEPVLSENHILA
jgi:thioesterase domain-containing protein